MLYSNQTITFSMFSGVLLIVSDKSVMFAPLKGINVTRNKMKTIALDFDKVVRVGNSLLASKNESERDAGVMLLVAIYTGLRKMDILKLSPKDFEEREKGECYVTGTANKTGKPFDYPIPKALYDAILEGCTLPGTIYSKQRSHIFLNRWIDKLFADEKRKALASRNGKRTISVHSLRKGFGMRVYEAKGINVARQALQHEDTATTSRYLELEAARLVDDLKAIW